MSFSRKRADNIDGITPKKMKRECTYGEKCYRKNPMHLREFYHPHLDRIMDSYSGTGQYPIPEHLRLYSDMIGEQLDIIREKGIDIKQTSSNPPGSSESSTSTASSMATAAASSAASATATAAASSAASATATAAASSAASATATAAASSAASATATAAASFSASSAATAGASSAATAAATSAASFKEDNKEVTIKKEMKLEKESLKTQTRDTNYRPMIPPTRRPQEFFKVVTPKGKMAEKHEKSAPFYIFYTTITSCPETHNQPLSITFQEILDISLGELRSSLQVNFMVEAGWLLAQYYFAGYSAKRLTILYGEENAELEAISAKKPNVDTYLVPKPSLFGTHHTKMMLLDYEDGSIRVVVSTANLYYDDWENRTQGLWFSPRCPPLPAGLGPNDGDSPTKFKASLLDYLHSYNRVKVEYYIDRVTACNFSHINVFLVGSIPGSHLGFDWGMKRVGALLKEYCAIPADENHEWEFIAQSSSLGSFGKEPTDWLTSELKQNFCKIKNNSSLQCQVPKLKIVYPSFDNVAQSHDNLLGGGCLPYSGKQHDKQRWITNYLYEWSARSSHRHKAMPHLKSYLRLHHDGNRAAYYLLTSGNLSKAAWGVPLKTTPTLKILSYELGVLFLPKFVTDQDYFSTNKEDKDALYIPYDFPLIKYPPSANPWIMDLLG